MILKPQDIVVLAKLITLRNKNDWSQNSIATELCLSPSQINSAFKRLVAAKLITPYQPPEKPFPILQACEEFLIHGLKYVFPAKQGGITRGVPTGYAAPIFKGQINLGNDPIPVWPYAEGNEKGMALTPLYSSVPESISKYPNPEFYNLLSLLDALRSGRMREKQIAEKELSNILKLRGNY